MRICRGAPDSSTISLSSCPFKCLLVVCLCIHFFLKMIFNYWKLPMRLQPLQLHLLLKCNQSLNLNEANTTQFVPHIYSARQQHNLCHLIFPNWIEKKNRPKKMFTEKERGAHLRNAKTHLRNEGNVFSASLFPYFQSQMLRMAVWWVDCHQSNKYWFCERMFPAIEGEKEQIKEVETMVWNVRLKWWRWLWISKPMASTSVWKHNEEAPQPHKANNGNGTRIKC